MTRVTIGLPTYNRAARLEEAIASVLHQTHVDLKLTISDNASTDDTARVCAEAAALDPRVRVVTQPRNLGPIGNFNAILPELTGEYVMFLADDDQLAPDFLQVCLEAFAGDPSLAVVQGRTAYPGGEPPDGATDAPFTAPDPAKRMLRYLRQASDNHGLFYGLVRSDVMRAAGSVPNVLGADWAWCARLVFLGPTSVCPQTSLRRARGGVSVDFQRIVAVLGLPARTGRRPMARILAAVTSDVASESPVYGPPGIARRWLAMCALATLARVHGGGIVHHEIGILLANPVIRRLTAPLRAAVHAVLRLRSTSAGPGRT